MVFPRIYLALISRNQLLGLRAASGILSHTSYSNTAAGLTRFWRTYSGGPSSIKGGIARKVDESQDLFDGNPVNETEIEELSSLKVQHGSIELGAGEESDVERNEASDSMDGPRYISRGKLMAAHRARMVPELKEEDLEEMFVRGSGPGGQAINKTSSSVSLIHRPTGIRVQCQATRSREQNRKIARKIMLDKLDQLANPGLSKSEVQQEKVRAKKRQRAKKAKKKAKLKVDAGSVANDENCG
ncbi:unnamed protein product [Rhizoctonia solani]|uniref:Prokaryotic-type class I peptide chain release factors domain-containing protein n=1 Tax=Rhizoctonia solani TaxID=456999 RepID=A0A8H2XR46_9AGAM|nr:unnamed protein product [Rhizoctonia solani]